MNSQFYRIGFRLIERQTDGYKVRAALRVNSEQRWQSVLCGNIAQPDLRTEQRADNLRDDAA